MKKDNRPQDDLLAEYDFTKMKGGVRGKYVERYRAGTNLVKIDPDVAGKINEIASDVKECENRFVDGVKSACIRDCKYFLICKKKQKIP